MSSDRKSLALTFGDLKRAGDLMRIPDGAEVLVEQRRPADADRELLHAFQSIGIRFDPSSAGYARLIAAIGH